MQQSIEDILNKLPEVRWDRYAQANNEFIIYGWIKRNDKRFDFVILRFFNNQVDSFITSSAKYSNSIHKRLGFLIPHEPCKRVEDLFPRNEVNSIHLKH